MKMQPSHEGSSAYPLFAHVADETPGFTYLCHSELAKRMKLKNIAQHASVNTNAKSACGE
jgi:hypothetical protein